MKVNRAFEAVLFLLVIGVVAYAAFISTPVKASGTARGWPVTTGRATARVIDRPTEKPVPAIPNYTPRIESPSPAVTSRAPRPRAGHS